eukprot:CAMPEP_0178380052 /NCGR_PEP_ID=MMETSP0689_2-20121128/5261_1 /TAXON_ID=160604 /ORGANISM="Amphidinium massartii, Strain CS-259" /LENGTH=408 /DNA_ID=CAMNT_0020000177 /DNA_START=32 /DNA_END=1255 /DNA_ORIENTATION=-
MLFLSLLYVVVAFCLLVSPAFQRGLLYMHWVKWPRRMHQLADFNVAHFARNISCRTEDGETLHGWHLAPTRHAPDLVKVQDEEMLREKFFDHMLADGSEPVIVFMHGQAGGRGLPNRLETCRAMAAQLQAHVVVFDYRGFGDSSGSPSQSALMRDSSAMWQWLGDRRPAGAFLYGQSLGSGVASHFAAHLEEVGGEAAHRLQALILDVPFASIAAATEVNPIFKPFQFIPKLKDLLLSRLVDPWNSENAVKHISVPMLIFGAGHDNIVGPEGAARLHAAALRARGHPDPPPSCAHKDVRLVTLEGTTHYSTHRSNKWLAELSDFILEVASQKKHPFIGSECKPRKDLHEDKARSNDFSEPLLQPKLAVRSTPDISRVLAASGIQCELQPVRTRSPPATNSLRVSSAFP